MHPEAEIAADFWRHVNTRGHGDSLDTFPRLPALMAELERQYRVVMDLKGEEAEELRAYLVPTPDGPQHWVDLSLNDWDCRQLPPTAFPTLQAALYDYLLTEVGYALISNNYEIWLRAVTCILADAVRDPSRLTIPVSKRTNDRWVFDRQRTEPHTMVISDDWSVLRRETFDFACRNHEQHGEWPDVPDSDDPA